MRCGTKKLLFITALCLTLSMTQAHAKGGHGGGGGRGGGGSGHSSSFSGHGFATGFTGHSGFATGFSGRTSTGGFPAHSGFSASRTYSSAPSNVGRGPSAGGYSQHAAYSGSRSYTGGYSGAYVAGHYYGSHYYPGGYYGAHSMYYYRGYAPYGATFGFFMGGVVVGGVYSPYWWPYYSVPVPPDYYDPYYQYPYPAPSYVMEVPPPEATTAYPEQQGYATPPNQCYAPKMDERGSIINENGNPVPDFSKPVPCPAQ